MGALASSRKRESLPHLSSPDFHIPKKPRFSLTNQTPNQTLNSTVSRISRYPETNTQFRREVHAPCRVLKFGLLSKPRILGTDKMGNLCQRLYSAKKQAFEAIREKEVIDVDDDNVNYNEIEKKGKDVISVDSSVEAIEEGFKDAKLDNEVKIVEERSVVTCEGSLGVESGEKMLDLLGLEEKMGIVDVSSVEVYKTLLENVERRNGKLRALDFEIELNEKKWSSLQLLKPKKPEERQAEEEEIPYEPFIPLTEEEEDSVRWALSASNKRKILVSHKNSNIDITGQILRCLAPGAWLNDEVINVYLELLKEREMREPQKFLKSHFFSTFFYKKLTSGGKNVYDYKSVRRWTTERKLGYFLLDCDKIFVPVHREIHWCLAIINRKDRKFQYLDSLKGRDFKVMEHLARYYAEEVKDKSKKEIDVSTWEREFVEDLPEQLNGYDCGVFMIKYADFYSRGLGLCFSQDHMPYFRRRTAKEILRLKAE